MVNRHKCTFIWWSVKFEWKILSETDPIWESKPLTCLKDLEAPANFSVLAASPSDKENETLIQRNLEKWLIVLKMFSKIESKGILT